MRKALIHLNLCMALSVALLIYLDDRNPMMGFLRSKMGYLYLGLLCLLSAVNCILSIIAMQRSAGGRFLKKTSRKKPRDPEE